LYHNNKQIEIMTNGKAIKNSLKLVSIHNDVSNLLDSQEKMDIVDAAQFNDLLNIRSAVHNLIMNSLDNVSSSESRIMILNRL
jgi:hypothetical protein